MTSTRRERQVPKDASFFRSRRAFTLAEVIVSLLVLTLISGAVLGAFLFFSKGGISIGSYVEIDRQARVSLERFAVEVRMARAIDWKSSTEIDLTVPLGVLDSAGSYTVTYQYFDNSYGTPSLRETFSRRLNGGSFEPLLKGVSSLTFRRYKVGTPTDPAASGTNVVQASNDADTKQINLDLTAYRKGSIGVGVTNVVLSSRYVLRNKAVAN